MTLSVLDIANGISEILADYNAEVVYAPEYELKKMQTMKIAVMPVGRERKFASRLSYESISSIDIAVIHKCREESAVPELILLVENIGSTLLGIKIQNAVCVQAKWEPLYSVDDLRTKGLFICVIQVSFKEYV